MLNEQQLSLMGRKLIEDPTNDVLISSATYWEIAIKVRLGKLNLFVSQVDRLLVAQAIVEAIPIISLDVALDP